MGECVCRHDAPGMRGHDPGCSVGQSETSLPRRYCRCTSIGLANPHCQIHGNQQRQDSLTDQLHSVIRKANEMGCYDAADWITNRYEEAVHAR